MSAPIGVGDIVECIDARPHAVFGVRLTLNRLYVVARFWTTSERDDVSFDQVSLVEVPLPTLRYGGSWNIHRFRPIYRPKQELIESLKAPPRRVGEFA